MVQTLLGCFFFFFKYLQESQEKKECVCFGGEAAEGEGWKWGFAVPD